MSGSRVTVALLAASASLSGLFVLADERPPPPPPSGSGIHFQWSEQSWEVGFLVRFSALNQKTLTFSREGSTNDTWLLLDGGRMQFSAADADGAGRDAAERSWRYPTLRVSQRVVKFKGDPPSREKADKEVEALKHDTAVLLYEVHNLESVSRRIGLECMIDTMVAGNDQHPFAVPGTYGMITTAADFAKSDMPTYLWAMERPEPLRPGFRAVLTLKIGETAAPPDRVLVQSADDAGGVIAADGVSQESEVRSQRSGVRSPEVRGQARHGQSNVTFLDQFAKHGVCTDGSRRLKYRHGERAAPMAGRPAGFERGSTMIAEHVIVRRCRLWLPACVAAAAIVGGLGLPSAAVEDPGPRPQPQGAPGIVFQFSDQTWEVGFALRLSAVEYKTLTYSREGTTHFTRLLLDGRRVTSSALVRGADAMGSGGPAGAADAGAAGAGAERTWKHADSGVLVRPRVIKTKGERPPGDPGNAGLDVKQDTCLVLYDVHNADSKPHQIGLETTIDTMIAGNDQNPFVVPGKFGMITTLAEFAKSDVPKYLWAVERADPLRLGLRAVVTLRVGGNVSAPDRAATRVAGDSLFAIRWEARGVPPGQTVRFGYGIGLGIAPASVLPPLPAPPAPAPLTPVGAAAD
jgi:hypothetical protein